MKILSFSAVEILPALLNRSKTQTIRPAWLGQVATIMIHDNDEPPRKETHYEMEKKPRFKVGEKVQLMWKQRSKSFAFCKFCGRGWKDFKNREDKYWRTKCCDVVVNCGDFCFIDKKIGEVEITEVFEIEIRKDQNSLHTSPTRYSIWSSNGLYNHASIPMAKADGFKTYQDFFAWFDKAYDLTEPKKFHVYRWKWL